MTKSFLALKTTKRGQSIWANNPAVCQTYRVGERVKCKDPLFPFFICSQDAVCGNGHIRCGADYTEFLIIQVFTRELGHIQPWVNQVNDDKSDYGLGRTFVDIQNLYKPRFSGERANKVEYQFTAQRLKVLASYPQSYDAKRKLKHWSCNLHLPILTADRYIKLHPECTCY